MKIFIEKTGKEKQVKYSGTVKNLLSKLKIVPEEVIVSRKSDIITLDTKLADKDEIKILSVVSGG